MKNKLATKAGDSHINKSFYAAKSHPILLTGIGWLVSTRDKYNKQAKF